MHSSTLEWANKAHELSKVYKKKLSEAKSQLHNQVLNDILSLIEIIGYGERYKVEEVKK